MRTRGLFMAIALVIATALLAWAYPGARLVIPPSTITFSHPFHVVEMEVACLTCHEAASESTQASDGLLPTMDVCAGCHDVEDDDACGTCHAGEDYEPFVNPERPIAFNHSVHLEQGAKCADCHGDIGSAETPSEAQHMPTMARCYDCHGKPDADARCEKCHGDRVTLLDIHPLNWQHLHADRAVTEPEYCSGCHRTESFCLDCHRGDNVTGSIHDLNYAYTHGLDAAGKERDCSRCHDRQEFCVTCHESGNRLPLLHSSAGWAMEHGRVAREDVENCASCHEASDPTCARAGCHSDTDGLRGTDTPIHDPSPGLFDGEGAWHDDDGAFCFDCHTNTHTPGSGFCGYCHGDQ